MMHAHNGFLRSGVLLTGIVLGAAAQGAPGQTIQYPPARKSDVVDDYHGTQVPDPYRWLEDPDAPDTRVWIDAEPELLRYLVEKGSITVEGVSLTVAELDAEGFAVALVQHTLQVTTLGRLVPGATVNLETDVLAKYVERLVGQA